MHCHASPYMQKHTVTTISVQAQTHTTTNAHSDAHISVSRIVLKVHGALLHEAAEFATGRISCQQTRPSLCTKACMKDQRFNLSL